VKSLTLAERINDWLNPIVVKELRQAVQSRFVTAKLLLFLLLQLGFIGIYLVTSSLSRGPANEWEFHAGSTAFLVLQGILLGSCVLFLPLYTGLRMAGEHSDVNVDLLFITTLRPRAIVAGKLLSTLLLAVIIFSACTPFLMFTYLLRGIDIPTVLAVVALDFTVVAVGVQLALFIASIPTNRIIKVVFGLMAFGALVFGFILAIGAAVTLVEIGVSESRVFWMAAGIIAMVALLIIGLLFAGSVALLSPPSANRALPVRLFMLGYWVITGMICANLAVLFDDLQFFYPALIFNSALFCLGIVIAVNERESWTPRLARLIPRREQWRLLAFLFYSGAAGGVVFSVVMIGLTFLGVEVWKDAYALMRGTFAAPTLTEFREVYQTMALVCLYTYAYALTAVLVRRIPALRIKAVFTWVVMGGLVAIGSLVPFLVAFLVLFDNWHYSTYYYWLLACPFSAVGDFDKDHRLVYFIFVSAWAGIVTLGNVPWFWRQFRAFRPYVSARPPQVTMAQTGLASSPQTDMVETLQRPTS
jgi:hypothetical protein